jgi:pseudaminic acid cytidylyltransferase
LSNIAILPARGGSKRIIQKNIKKFLSEPIILRVIKQIKASGIFDQIIISTDSSLINSISNAESDIILHQRSSRLSDDVTGTQEVVRNVCIEQNISDECNVCCIYPTAALITAETLKQTAKRFAVADTDFLFSVKKFEHPIERGFQLNTDQSIATDITSQTFRTQELKPTYHDTGYFYWGKSAAWKSRKEIIKKGNLVHIYGPLEAFDIDEISDWEVAEKIARIK